MEDLRNYKVNVTDAMTANMLGYTISGMPPPSVGTLWFSMILNIFNSYGNLNAANGDLGLHRLIEALKHMRSQLRDHGTSHFCIVDADRNVVSMTTTINYPFGGGVLSPSTGIVLNNEMGDFSILTDISPDHLPPTPSNFIEPIKRPLSSMTPIIDNQLVGVLGGSGGLNIIPAVTQVFINYFILGMEPLAAVQSPRVYHRERGHELQAKAEGAITQLIVQRLGNPIQMGRKCGRSSNENVFHGILTAVSDPRKDGRPAAV
ncbi:putative gamma-glutamyltransferase, Omega peptidase [Rosa chinensis]|uniref:Putative gamma-glutamyltransferase, Omega peptidase n=1 Tax=Rosa chinensis TaxID=74649 RepID=A0A2P6S9K2_ROSCH|nr:putative gamma-glutamyltransferase, Omega peptidase [Rosa chinensis]